MGSDVSHAISSIFGDDDTYYRVVVGGSSQDEPPFLHQDVHITGAADQERARRTARVHPVAIDHGCVTGELRIDGRSAESCSNFVTLQANTSIVQVCSGFYA